MAGSILLGALGIVALILILLFWKINSDDSNYALQVILFAFILGIVVLLGKAAVDYKDNCSWLVSNSTTSGSMTSYTYTYECSVNENSTQVVFYKICLWVTRLTAIYLVMTFAFEVIKYFGWWKKGGKQE